MTLTPVRPSPDAATERYEAITLKNWRSIPQIQALSADLQRDIDVVARVLPFKSNRFVIEQLIDWSCVPEDPIYRLTFPQKEMLAPDHYARIEGLLARDAAADEITQAANEIRLTLNPHPAGQMEHNVPQLNGKPLPGMQHKYRETVLFFPSQGQTCHAYCSFCFRWPQFVGMDGLKFAMREADQLRDYVEAHPEISDVLFTGGDPLVMKTRVLQAYIDPLLEPDVAPNLRTIRIGSKALSYWPQRFTSDDDADDMLALLERVIQSGRQVALMAHFNHAVELEPVVTQQAIQRLRSIGVQIRTQTPLLHHINDDADVLASMWRRQTQLGCIPYYLFIARDTGAKRYFELPLERCWDLFRDAYKQVSGVARTVRGPSMSATPGKVQVLGVADAGGERVFVLRMIQGRNPDWVGRPFFAKYDPTATWLDDLTPAFGESEFFYDGELRELLAGSGSPWSSAGQSTEPIINLPLRDAEVGESELVLPETR